MIAPEELAAHIRAAMPDAEVEVLDKTGMSDHFRVAVTSSAFTGVKPLDRQRLVYAALREPMEDGRIHALEIRAIPRSAG